MARKLKGSKSLGKVTGKGLKAALAREVSTQAKASKQAAALQAKEEPKPKKKIAQKPQANQKGLIPFEREDKLLLVGEGDFSFAVSIIKQNLIEPKNLVATSFDSLEELKAKYPNVEENLEILTTAGSQLYHSIDATNLVKSLKLANKKLLNNQKLDYVMFNFPHTGRGMKNMDRNIRDHQNLVLKYLQNCKQLLQLVNDEKRDQFAGYAKKEAKIILSIFEGEPYISWNIKILAKSETLKVERSGKFDWEMFPGYHHRRTNGIRDTTKPAAERAARIYVFEKFKGNEQKKKNDEESDDE